jgi:hypothetical protein
VVTDITSAVDSAPVNFLGDPILKLEGLTDWVTDPDLDEF